MFNRWGYYECDGILQGAKICFVQNVFNMALCVSLVMYVINAC